MSEFNDVECSAELCTYAIGKTNPIQQAIYTCETCAGDSNVCCCAGCAETCHKGHEVNFVAFGESYCDCGHGGCQLVQKSQKTAEKLLGDKTISFDKSGRVGGTSINDHCSVDSFAANEIVGLNAQSASVLREECINLVAHSKETFWLGMTDQPRCLLEEMAALIFKQHIAKYTDCAGLDVANSGAEWWTQVKYCDEVMDTGSDSVNTGDDDSAIVSSGVDLHYDKDEEVAALFGVGIFPHISTVTYLTDNANNATTCSSASQLAAAPTVIFETTASQPVGSGIKRCFVSLAEVGKHVSFDGRYLHGAPAQLRSFARDNYTGSSSSGSGSNDATSGSTDSHASLRAVRVTFLVNVWLNHHPAAIAPLPADIVTSLANQITDPAGNNRLRLRPMEHMSFAPPTLSSSSSSSCDTFPLTSLDVTAALTEEEGDGSDLGEWQRVPFVSKQTEWGKGDDEAGLALVVWVPYSVQKTRVWQSCRASSSGGGNKKKKTKLTHNTLAVSADSKSSVIPVDAPCSNTFSFHFKDRASHSRLEYDEDSEAEEEFAGEFQGSM